LLRDHRSALVRAHLRVRMRADLPPRRPARQSPLTAAYRSPGSESPALHVARALDPRPASAVIRSTSPPRDRVLPTSLPQRAEQKASALSLTTPTLLASQ